MTVLGLGSSLLVIIIIIIITIAQILAEAKLLSTTCDPIVNKPKLKVEPPKDETKQDGDKKQDGKDDENTGQHPATEQEDTTHNMSAGESQLTSSNAGTEYTMHSAPTDIDTNVERHFTFYEWQIDF